MYAVIDYIFKSREDGDPVIYHNCMEGLVADQMVVVQEMHRKKNLEGIHIIQSFNETDSKMFSPEKYTEIGSDLIKKMFPSHQFVVVTHTDTDKVHNHIVVNPVNEESGKKIHNKIRLLYDLRKESDNLSLERGLSIIEDQSNLRWERQPEDVRAIKKRGGFSWVIDLKEKCDFSRQLATSFDEYAGILNQFGIQVRVENKNIQYYYPSKRQKRGGTKGLGQNYTKEGLIENFKKNYENFYSLGLKTKPIDEIDFSDHWKFPRKLDDYLIPEYRFKDLVFPVSTFKKVAKLSLINLCQNRGIELESTTNGYFSIKGRDHIKVSDNEWWNESRGTQGGSLELLSYLDGKDFLSVLASFDKTDRIKKIIDNIEIKKMSFQAFYIKKQVKGNQLREQKRLAQNFGFSAQALDSLLKKSQIKFYSNNRLKAYPSNNRKTSLTFYKFGEKWSCKKEKGLSQLFYLSINSENARTIIFNDPITFLKSNRVLKKVLQDKPSFNLIVPLSPLNYFLEEYEKLLRKASSVSIINGEHPVIWGDKESYEKQKIKENEILNDMKISYGSIDELLRYLLMRTSR